jgi:hypothetical protein
VAFFFVNSAAARGVGRHRHRHPGADHHAHRRRGASGPCR